eukprot:1443931-Prymnesium_polylepis.1
MVSDDGLLLAGGAPRGMLERASSASRRACTPSPPAGTPEPKRLGLTAPDRGAVRCGAVKREESPVTAG